MIRLIIRCVLTVIGLFVYVIGMHGVARCMAVTASPFSILAGYIVLLSWGIVAGYFGGELALSIEKYINGY